MTSLRQIEANRRNASKSTGPKTENGKRRSRRNAIRHGLCAETVIEILEDIEDYRGFEAAIIADYDAQTVVQRELVLRLASLLWRLRRATSIETNLLRIQAEILRDRRACESRDQPDQAQDVPCGVFATAIPGGTYKYSSDAFDDVHSMHSDESVRDPTRSATNPISPARELTHCFQRLANLDPGLFERAGRYQAALWRQVVQTLFFLQTGERSNGYRRRFPSPFL